MIVVKVELHSARTGRVTELARMAIINDGTGSKAEANYTVATYRGRDAASLARRIVQRTGHVMGWHRERQHVWRLVSAALKAMGYVDEPPE